MSTQSYIVQKLKELMSYINSTNRQTDTQIYFFSQLSGPEVVTMGEWTPRKLEKQRSVTFASIDLLEPIEEDFPQVFDFKFPLLDYL